MFVMYLIGKNIAYLFPTGQPIQLMNIDANY